MKHEIIYIDSGRTDYRSSLNLQKYLVEKKGKNSKIPDFLIFTEHNPVITLGKRGGRKFIDRDSFYFQKNNPEIIETERGGLVTCHMPGQMVIYPIINLKNFKIGVKEYALMLTDLISDFLKKYGVNSYSDKNYPGVFVDKKKIGSIGLAVKKNITCHGLSINIDNDYSLFDTITPCGLKNTSVTRLVDETDINADTEDIKQDLINSFSEVFDCGVIKQDINDSN
jgi:lipoyl(octanoyl) transferase